MRDRQFLLNKIFEVAKEIPSIIEHLTLIEDIKSDALVKISQLEKEKLEMQARIDKRDVIIERYFDLCACNNGFTCSLCRDASLYIDKLNQGG